MGVLHAGHLPAVGAGDARGLAAGPLGCRRSAARFARGRIGLPRHRPAVSRSRRARGAAIRPRPCAPSPDGPNGGVCRWFLPPLRNGTNGGWGLHDLRRPSPVGDNGGRRRTDWARRSRPVFQSQNSHPENLASPAVALRRYNRHQPKRGYTLELLPDDIADFFSCFCRPRFRPPAAMLAEGRERHNRHHGSAGRSAARCTDERLPARRGAASAASRRRR